MIKIFLNSEMSAEEALLKAIQEINEIRDESEHISSSYTGIIIGNQGILDSLSITVFIISIEGYMLEKHGKKIDLMEALISSDGMMRDLTIENIVEVINNA